MKNMTNKDRINAMLIGDLVGRISVSLVIFAGLLLMGKLTAVKSDGVADARNLPSAVTTKVAAQDSVRALPVDSVQRVR